MAPTSSQVNSFNYASYSTAFCLILLAVLVGLEACLVIYYPGAVPYRDFVACIVAILGLVVAFAMKRQSSLPRPIWGESFVQKFKLLEMFHLFFTVVAPWALIIRSILFDKEEKVHIIGYLLASHLFVMQAQIALECIIVMFGYFWITFPYTIVANAYRVVALATWLIRSNDILKTWNPRELEWTILTVLPGVASIFWLHFCFMFIPFEWYPLLPKKEDFKADARRTQTKEISNKKRQ